MSVLVGYICPTHGEVIPGAPQGARVICHCGEECAPEGETPAQHRSAYLARHRKQAQRKRDIAHPTALVPQQRDSL